MDLLHSLVGSGMEDMTWWQMCVRAVIVFAYAIVLLRLAPRRSFGKSTIFDIVLVVIIGSALSRTLTGNAPLVPTMAAAAALVALHALAAFVAYRWSGFGRVLKGRELVLARRGHFDRDAMRKACLTERDLEEALRLNAGTTEVAQTDAVILERSGDISVIRTRSGRSAGNS